MKANAATRDASLQLLNRLPSAFEMSLRYGVIESTSFLLHDQC